MILNKRWQVALGLFAAMTLSMTACGKKPSATQEEAAPAEGAKQEAAAPAPAAGVGTIKGKVSFTGTLPEIPELNRMSDPFCAKTKMKAQYVVINPDKTLKNVAIRVEGAEGDVDPSAVVEIDQSNCMYAPRVITGFDNENIKIVNSDPTLHNVHTYAGTKTLFNRAQPKGSPPITKSFSMADGDIIKFKCDVHPWMTGWLLLSKNGFGAVTGDAGEFEIKNVPAGTYKVTSFQETYGVKTQEVTVEPDKTAEVNFSYDGTEKAAYNFREVIISHLDHVH